MKRSASQDSVMRDTQRSSTVSIPAPVGGWNTKDPIAAMPATDAIVLNNWYPNNSEVRVRGGCANHKTGFAKRVKSLFAFASATTKKLFAATNDGIYDATTAGAVGSTVATLTEGHCQYVNFRTSAGSFLYVVNGVDKPQLYDGTTWTAIDGASTPAITGVTTTSLINISIFKSRIWFVQKDSMSAWYLPTQAVGGAAAEFPLGHLFSKGGHLVATGAWTIDGGSGADDFMVFVTSEGEVAVYQGTDPASPTTFALSGVYYIGAPLGRRCLAKFGGDVIYLSKQGAYPLSKALQSASVDRSIAFTDKIAPSFIDYADDYGDNQGWNTVLFPKAGFLLINAPIDTAASSLDAHQFVMNVTTGAWCRFVGWEATCFEVFDDRLFFAGESAVVEAWTGESDYGNNIVASAQTGYTYLGQNSQIKHFKMVRPVLVVDRFRVFNLHVAIEVDFTDDLETSQQQFGDNSISTYDTDSWNLAVWAAGKEVLKEWFTCAAEEGYAVSFEMQFSSKQTSANWAATDFIFQQGGAL